MSLEAQSKQLKQDFDKVYEAGQLSYEERFFHSRSGNENYYGKSIYLFSNMNLSNFTFQKTYKPKGYFVNAFYNYRGTYLPKNMDFSGITSVFYSIPGVYQFYTWASNLLIIPDLGMPAITLGNSFDYCRACHTIEKIRINETQKPPTFTECYALVNLTFEGVIGKDINVSPCSKLSHDSLMNIIDCLKDYSEDTSGTVYTVTMGSTNIAKLAEEEKEIIYGKGWQLQ